MKILVRPVRRPLTKVGDLANVQRFILTRVNEEIIWRARVTPRLILVCEDHLEEVDLDKTDGDPIATFHALATRRDVVQRVLCGTATGEDGEEIGFVFGANNRDDTPWWLASRGFTRQPGGLGSAGRTWDVGTGFGLEELPVVVEAMRTHGRPCDLLPARSLPWPEIGCKVDDLANEVIPLDPQATTQILAQRGHEIELWKRGLDTVMIMAFRRGTLEKWSVDGEIPCSTDELVRSICGIGPAPDAVAILRIELFDDHGTYRRAVRTVAETGGHRIERLLVLDFDSMDQVVPHLRLFGTRARAVGREGWIGVRAGVKLELTPQVAEA